MLIVLGGLPGSGRIVLAQMLSEQNGFHWYNLASKKHHRLTRRADGFREHTVRPQTDDQYMHVYQRVLADFPLVSKMHSDVVVSDSFHRATPREFFLKEAENYFCPVVFVWVESPEEYTRPRLERMHKLGMMMTVEKEMQRRAVIKSELEPFSSPPLIFDHEETNDAAAKRLWNFIQCSVSKK